MGGSALGFVAAAGLVLLGTGACDRKPPTEEHSHQHADEHAAASSWVCPMHPEVQQADRGTCPKCGMDLVLAGAHADHAAKHGGLFGMQGDHHVELVVRPSGEIEVYLYDAFTKPLDLAGVQANVALEIPAAGTTAARVVPVQLARTAGGEAFAGRSPDAAAAHAATVEVQLPGDRFSMTFPLQVTRADIWAQIDRCQADLDAAIRAGELARVHALAFAIRDQVVALEERFESAHPTERERIVDAIDASARKLDELGDGGNAAGTKAEFAAFVQHIEALRGLEAAR